MYKKKKKTIEYYKINFLKKFDNFIQNVVFVQNNNLHASGDPPESGDSSLFPPESGDCPLLSPPDSGDWSLLSPPDNADASNGESLP